MRLLGVKLINLFPACKRENIESRKGIILSDFAGCVKKKALPLESFSQPATSSASRRVLSHLGDENY